MSMVYEKTYCSHLWLQREFLLVTLRRRKVKCRNHRAESGLACSASQNGCQIREVLFLPHLLAHLDRMTLSSTSSRAREVELIPEKMFSVTDREQARCRSSCQSSIRVGRSHLSFSHSRIQYKTILHISKGVLRIHRFDCEDKIALPPHDGRQSLPRLPTELHNANSLPHQVQGSRAYHPGSP